MHSEEQQLIPTHLGLILDGNRRWAKKHGLPAYEGHLAGHNVLKEILPHIVDKGVRYITLYVFSTENWKRSKEEVDRLMGLLIRVLTDDLKAIAKHQVRVRVAGTRHNLSPKVLAAIEQAEEKTKHFTRATVIFCFNYSGLQEISDAVQQCLTDGLQPAQITPLAIRERLYAPDVPDLDLVVRTGGEQRLSNFSLWRTSYSEYAFLEKLWPEMQTTDFDNVFKEYGRRARRFGG